MNRHAIRFDVEMLVVPANFHRVGEGLKGRCLLGGGTPPLLELSCREGGGLER